MKKPQRKKPTYLVDQHGTHWTPPSPEIGEFWVGQNIYHEQFYRTAGNPPVLLTALHD